jgi:hypothetical protein
VDSDCNRTATGYGDGSDQQLLQRQVSKHPPTADHSRNAARRGLSRSRRAAPRRRKFYYAAAAEKCLSARRRRRHFVRRAAEALLSCALFDFVFYVHCSSVADLSQQVVILSFYLANRMYFHL